MTAAFKETNITQAIIRAGLFIPTVIILNHIWKLNGVIAAQPVVETILALICILLYRKDYQAKNPPVS